MHTIINKQSQPIAERRRKLLEHDDNEPLKVLINMDAFSHHPWDEGAIKGKCIPVGSVDFLNFLVSLKTLDFFSSVLRFQGLVMIAKHVASCLSWKSSAHVNVYLAEALLDTGFEGLPRPSFLEWQFSKYSFCCAPAVFDTFAGELTMVLRCKKDGDFCIAPPKFLCKVFQVTHLLFDVLALTQKVRKNILSILVL